MVNFFNHKVIPTLGLIITLIAVALASELFFYIGITIFTQQALGLVLGCSLAIVFISTPIKGKQKISLPLYDLICAVLGLLVGIYISYRYPVVSAEFYERREEAFWIGIIVVPLVIEALRRTAGLGLVLIVLVFLLYGFFADLVPGQLNGRSQSFFKLIAYLGTDLNALFGLPLIIITTIVLLFILFGQVLLKSGGSDWFTDLAMSLTGRSRGGSAKISIVASAMFGSISGSAVSNVASTGVLTIPLMRKGGYTAPSAGAFEAVASTGGQIMPPIMGAAAFLMAERLELSYNEVILAALVPALLFYYAIFIQADIEAIKRKIPAIPKEEIRPFISVIREGWYFFIPFIILIFSLFELNKRPETAAIWAIASSIILSFIFSYKGKKLNFQKVLECLINTGRAGVDILIIGAMAGLIIGVVEVTGLSFGLTFVLVQLGGQNVLLLLIVTALVSIVLGMGMPTTAIYLIVATLAAPPLVELGIEKIAADMFVLYFGLMSMITPPVAIAAFTAANLAKAKPMHTALLACKYGWPAFILPFIFVFSPALLLQGTTYEILLSTISTLFGVWACSVGINGFFRKNLNLFHKSIFVFAGVLLLMPFTDYSFNTFIIKFAGILLSITGIVISYIKK